ncbi:MAG: Beta-galactosidase [Promethearchaeota archaeon]|nr:MAG: Beta-galactosidase [Candidatus Lokiarchaeota archaeon]
MVKKKIIENPFYGLNEKKVKWVYESTWNYTAKFDLKEDFLKSSVIFLELEGLDTIADIYLNGELLDSVKNMFRSYKYSVKSKLKKTSNNLTLFFHSPTEFAKDMIDKYDMKLNTGEENRAFPGVPYLRKAQYSFGWDWGPILPDIGIWKDVKLTAMNTPKIESIYVFQDFKYDQNTNEINSVNLNINIEIESVFDNISNQDMDLLCILKDPHGKSIQKEKTVNSLKEGIQFKIDNPKLWWTHDLGLQNLYNLTIQLRNNEILDEYQQKIGLRDLKLIRNSDKWGKSFYFQLNGIPIFAKGANWIPVDSFIPRGKRAGLYEMNLHFAKEANMNMIRVWGGGIYEDELFYQICNKLGILVWQDFPFACAIYPIHDEFYENIQQEFKDNIKRLRNHPSLALWCGNNEIEYLWNFLKVSAGITDEEIEKNYKKGYVKIFENMLPRTLEKLDPNRPFWPSSPSNGHCGMSLGTINSNSPDEGDSHYWSVWHGGKPFRAYRRFNSRFMSEFGFESFPSLKTISSFCPKDQYYINSPIMENHQKNDAGNDLIMRYIKRRYNVPKDFRKQVILSQITQAEAVEYGVKYWRSQTANFHCMGSLYWQLNDCWPVASWSSIDYYGRWKALHYLAKRFYQPIIVEVYVTTKKIEFALINDSLVSYDVILQLNILNSGGQIVKRSNSGYELNAMESKKGDLVEIKDLASSMDLKNDCIVFYTLMNKNTKNIIYRGFKLFDSPNSFHLKDPHLKFHIYETSDNETENCKLNIQITSENISLYTFIESDIVDFIASDNFFAMEPNELRKIEIRITKNKNFSKKYTSNEIKESFRVNSLYDLLT